MDSLYSFAFAAFPEAVLSIRHELIYSIFNCLPFAFAFQMLANQLNALTFKLIFQQFLFKVLHFTQNYLNTKNFEYHYKCLYFILIMYAND